MNEKRLTLKDLMRTLAEAASYANGMLRRDYESGLREMKGEGFSLAPPPPLQIAGMRITFNAQVDEIRHTDGIENGADVGLDFGKPDGNFKGDVYLRPYDPESSCAWDAMIREDNGDQQPADSHAVTEMPGDHPEGETYESSQNYIIN